MCTGGSASTSSMGAAPRFATRPSRRVRISSTAASYSAGPGRAGVVAVQRGVGDGQLVRLHERDTGALERVRNDRLRARRRSSRSSTAASSPRSWPSQRLDRPAEHAQLLLRSPRSLTCETQVSDCTLFRSTISVISPKAPVRRRLERLPELPLLQLAVAGEDVDPPGAAEQPVGEDEATGLRHHPSRASRCSSPPRAWRPRPGGRAARQDDATGGSGRSRAGRARSAPRTGRARRGPSKRSSGRRRRAPRGGATKRCRAS